MELDEKNASEEILMSPCHQILNKGAEPNNSPLYKIHEQKSPLQDHIFINR